VKHENLIIVVGISIIAVCLALLSVAYVPPPETTYTKVGTVYQWNGADGNITVGSHTFFIHHGENFIVNGSDIIK
jgi:hypothetical protein